MNAASFDIGSRTGIVLATIDFRMSPLVNRSLTWHYQGTEVASSLSLLDTHIGKEMKRQEVLFILLEFPHVLPRMPNYKEMKKVSHIFREFIESYREKMGDVSVTVREIRPTEWKSTPAKHAKFPERALTTKHEKDAYRMLWWFSMYGSHNRVTHE